MEDDLRIQIAILYGVGVTVDETAWFCEVTVDEIEELVLNDPELRQMMSAKRLEFEENNRRYRERRSKARSTPQQRAKQNEYLRSIILKKPQLKVRHNIASAISKKLKGNKTNYTFVALGYTVQDLINHLEAQFKDGMTWENYGSKWHIDHKMPDSWFSYVSMECEGFKQSWALSNLQPLWKEDNLAKNNRYASV